MKIFNSEKHIADKILQNRITADASLILNNNSDVKHLAFACQGNACAMSALGGADWKITDDVTPISSILVTDIWNANGDLFTAEEIVKASETPIFKPINWMHRGSEDSENENIGVMVKSMLVSGDLPSIDFMNEFDKNNFLSLKMVSEYQIFKLYRIAIPTEFALSRIGKILLLLSKLKFV
jgi:hypothetical protein